MAARALRTVALAGLVGLAVSLSATAAADPPLPTELRLYGVVSLAGINLDPAEQPVIALVGGRACGSGSTFLNSPSESVDPGKTVYVIDVAASGTRANEIEGCGVAGAPIRLYFPAAGQLAPETVPFPDPGGPPLPERLDIDLGATPLPPAGRALLLASDGVN